MPVLLQSFSQPGATPIANRTASWQAFCNNYFKLSNETTTVLERKTIDAISLIYELANKTAVNYKLNHKGLIRDAIVWTAGLSLFDITTGMAAVDFSIGKTADASLNTDLNALLKEGQFLSELPEEHLDRILVFLNAQLMV